MFLCESMILIIRIPGFLFLYKLVLTLFIGFHFNVLDLSLDFKLLFKMKRLPLIFTLFLLLSLQLSAQFQEGLRQGKTHYLPGKSILIGNNILGDHSSKPLLNDGIKNDEVKMVYIDVDDNKRTFSSSEAILTNFPETGKIVYAGLYWSALYPFERGVLRTTLDRKIEYKERGKRDPEVNEVWLKLPGKEYETIRGEVLFNGFETEKFEAIAPYVCYADVTESFKNVDHINGVYTVANVKAAEGQIPGGGSAGWLLYLIFEDENEKLRYFSTYDGFVEVHKDNIDLNFSGFKNPGEGEIRSSLGVGVLEGDRQLRTDQLLIFSDKRQHFMPIRTSLREETNFFNSSITLDDYFLKKRNPNSSNTLGFDLLNMEIPNAGNVFFDGNSTSMTMRFRTRVDRFFLFFVSFETEIDSLPDDSEMMASLDKDETKSVVKEEVIVKENTEVETQVKEEFELSPIEDSQQNNELSGASQQLKEPQLQEENESRKSYTYYIVTHVFQDKSNAENWMQELRRKGFSPSSLIHEKNGWIYVYIESFSNRDAGEKEIEKFKKEYGDWWLMEK